MGDIIEEEKEIILTQKEIRILKAFVSKMKGARTELNKNDGVIRNVNFADIINKTVED